MNSCAEKRFLADSVTDRGGEWGIPNYLTMKIILRPQMLTKHPRISR